MRKNTSAFANKCGWKSLKWWDAENINRIDWIVTILILAGLFVTCIQGDLRLTGNRSFTVYHHLADFYKASYEQSGGYYANYLPSTFIAYAIWNLPLYLLGHVPEEILTNSFINMMWYKLLPVLLYVASSRLIYKIGKEVGFGERKSRICRFAFLVFPIGVFSQFIFAQYDIFTVFFMLLGLYFYVKGGMRRFALLFGIAATFKYHAILYFLVLLVLKEKKIRNLFSYGVIMGAPLAIEILPGIRDPYFLKNVFGFGALQYVQKTFSVGFFHCGLNLVAAASAFVLVWAYQKKVKKEEQFSWAMFLCVAISFAIFGFSTWNPQWLLLMVPFLLLNIFMNENGNLLMMITNVFMLACYIFCSQSMVTEKVLVFGVMKYLLPHTDFARTMWDIYMFHDEELLCTAMWIVLLCYVVFGHPNYHKRRGEVVGKGMVWQIRAAFLFGVFAFVVPLAFSAYGIYQGKITYYNNCGQNLELDNTIEISENSTVRQEIIADGHRIDMIRGRIHIDGNETEEPIYIRLWKKATGEVLYEGEKDTSSFKKNSLVYPLLTQDIVVEPGEIYILEMSSKAPSGAGYGMYCVATDSKKELLENTQERSEKPVSRLQLRITGMK
ncbi:MAG: DUF2029 domain-containing protein [Blautia sp.]|nr:DUF2029 domain-containing protein [Blautia sp.]